MCSIQTTDICALLPNGFPRQAPNFVEVAGVRTAFSMPEVFSIGLGGGSRVRQSAEHGGKVTVGPDSVALRLTTDAMVFGGDVMTSTDVVVASGAAANIGQAEKVKHISAELIGAAKADIKRQLERAIDNMKVSSAPVSMLLVGGGSIILTDDLDLDGVEECLRPPHHDSANAVGAAIAKVAGEIDVIEVLAGRDEDAAVEAAKQAAIKAAISNGADESTVQIVEIKKIPLQYVTNKATRFVMKAVGNLKVRDSTVVNGAAASSNGVSSSDTGEDFEAIGEEEVKKAEITKLAKGSLAKPALDVDLTQYRPRVEDGIWYISPVDVEMIASGAGVLGTGGGGSSYLMALYTQNLLRESGAAGKIRVMRPEDLKDSDICVFGAGYGAPSVSDERISSGTDVFTAIDAVNTILGIEDFDAIVTDEIGGGNGLVTMPTSAKYDRPIVDCDLMGRAYPTLEHGTPYVYGFPVLPVATADCKGNCSVTLTAESNKKVESLIRNTCIEMGNSTGTAGRPLEGKIIKKYTVTNTISQAWYLGRAVHLARQTKLDFIEAIVSFFHIIPPSTPRFLLLTHTRTKTGQYNTGQVFVYRQNRRRHTRRVTRIYCGKGCHCTTFGGRGGRDYHHHHHYYISYINNSSH